MTSFSDVRKDCSNQKLKFIGKIGKMTKSVNDKINNNFDIWNEVLNF